MNVFQSERDRGGGKNQGLYFHVQTESMVSDTENIYKIQARDSGNDSDLRMNHLCSSGQVSFDYYHAVFTVASV